MCICSGQNWSPLKYLLSEESRVKLALKLPELTKAREELSKKKYFDAHLLDNKAESIFIGGKIYTMNEACSNVEAVAVSGGKIVFAGSKGKAL